MGKGLFMNIYPFNLTITRGYDIQRGNPYYEHRIDLYIAPYDKVKFMEGGDVAEVDNNLVTHLMLSYLEPVTAKNFADCLRRLADRIADMENP